MNPQEKAKELLVKYKNLTTYQYQEYAGASYSTFEHDIDTIKQCALIVVDEVIEEAREYCDDNFHQERLIYWQQVKEEINKLDNL